jgi:hypothetical protein
MPRKKRKVRAHAQARPRQLPPLTPRLLTVKQAAAYTSATVWAIRRVHRCAVKQVCFNTPKLSPLALPWRVPTKTKVSLLQGTVTE